MQKLSSITMTLVVGVLIFIALRNFPQNNNVSLSSTQQGEGTHVSEATVESAYPPPFTPTVGTTLPPLPNPTADVIIPSPTTFPTTIVGLPNGSNINFAEITSGGLTIWSASATDPFQRVILARIDHDIRGFNASISLDQKNLAIVATEALNSRINANLYIARLDSNEISLVATGIALGRYQNYPTWSSDNKHLAVLRQSHTNFPYEQSVSIVDTETGREITIAKVKISNTKDEAQLSIYPLDWSSDGQYLYFQKGAYDIVELWQYSLTSDITRKVNVISLIGIPRCYYLSPDDMNFLCLISSADLKSYSVSLISTTSSNKRSVLENISSEEFSDPIWSPNGERLALGVFNSTLKKTQPHVIALQNKMVTVVPLKSSNVSRDSAFPVSWSPDGVWLLVNVVSDVQKFYLVNVDGNEETELILPAGATIIGWTNNQATK